MHDGGFLWQGQMYVTKVPKGSNTQAGHLRTTQTSLFCYIKFILICYVTVCCTAWLSNSMLCVCESGILGTSLTLTCSLIHGYGVYIYLGDEGLPSGANWTIEVVLWLNLTFGISNMHVILSSHRCTSGHEIFELCMEQSSPGQKNFSLWVWVLKPFLIVVVPTCHLFAASPNSGLPTYP